MSKAEAIHAHTRVAAILGGQGKTEEALAEFREAIAIADADPPVHSGLRAWLWNQVGNLSERLERPDDAIAAFRQAAAIAKPPPPAGQPSDGATGPTGPVGATGTPGGTGP